ncbi:MAG: hypothetical protein HRU03_02370 [Nanoarchaeales archaeon]|nr:hypothetical protein [Nanoarchaeales archaeon]
MRKLELKILIIILAIFLIIFSFIPEGKEDVIFTNSTNELNNSNSIKIDSSQTSIIVRQIVEGNNSVEIENLSDKDKFVFDSELEKSNEEFEKLQKIEKLNSSNVSVKIE